jgi:hypothetical protein
MANADDGGRVMPRIRVARRRYIIVSFLWCERCVGLHKCTFGAMVNPANGL